MATSYTRQSSMSDGDTITAALFNDEFNQLLTAFSYASSSTTGHRHDGTAGEGGNIHTIGDQDFLNKIVADDSNNRWGVFVEVSSAAVEQVRFQDGVIVPVTDNDIDLGTSSVEFKDAYFDGTVTTDGLTVSSTTNLDGAIQLDNTLTAGVDGTGYDIKFFGDTAGSYLLWDESADSLLLTDSTPIKIGDSQDMTLYHDGSNSYITNAVGALKLATETSGIIVTIGHTTSETTVADNLTVTGNASIGGDLDVTGSFDMSDANITNIGSIALDTITNDGTDITLDSSGDIILDAGGGDVFFKDDGTTFGSATNTSGNLIIKSGTTTALTFSGANVTGAGTYTGGGLMTTGGNIVIPDAGNIGSASDTDAIAISSGGVVTMNQIPVFSAGINVSGGSIAGTLSTAAQGNVTSLGTLTALTVDDVAIDGKVITMTGSASDTVVFTAGTNGTLSIVTTDAAAAAANIQITADGTVDIDSAGVLTLDSGAAINIEPASGSAILLDGTISVDAGVVTGATSITSTAFVGDITGDVTGNVSGTAGVATTVTITDNESTNETNAIIFTAGGDVDGGNLGLESDGDLTYNPSTGLLSSTGVTASGTVTYGTLSDGTIGVTAWVDEDDMSSDSATLVPTQQSVKAYVDGQSAGMSSFILEDDDGTEVSISDAEEVKFIGSGITTNWTDTTPGSDADPFDMTFTVDAAQTGITSLLATDIKIGEDDQTKIDFETADEIHFYAANAEQVYIADGIFGPQSDNDVDLGASGVEWKDAYFDGTVTTDALVADTADINGGSIDGATLGTNSAITQAVIDNVNINGATIGHTDDTDLLTLADGIVTVAGEVSLTTLDIGGTNVTSTAAELNILDGVTSTAAELNILDGVTSTAAELNSLDGITAVVGELNALDIGATAVGTAVASKAVILDSNKDYTGVRNFTVSGELDAATGDFSGDVDIDGTLEADAYTVNGTALDEYIADTVGAMVGSNTESGITVAYQDSDNTLDFTVGTLNQNTTGSAATVTTAAQGNITSLGTLTTLTVDNIRINGTTIGHTSDTDLMTLASGVLTVTGEIRATGNVTAYYSDNRLKTKLGPIENALHKVSTLSGFYYEANETAQALGYAVQREVGVSAQEVQAVLPEIVVPAPIDDQYLTVQYDKLVPLLIEAIKELSAKVENLENN